MSLLAVISLLEGDNIDEDRLSNEIDNFFTKYKDTTNEEKNSDILLMANSLGCKTADLKVARKFLFERWNS